VGVGAISLFSALVLFPCTAFSSSPCGRIYQYLNSAAISPHLVAFDPLPLGCTDPFHLLALDLSPCFAAAQSKARTQHSLTRYLFLSHVFFVGSFCVGPQSLPLLLPGSPTFTWP